MEKHTEVGDVILNSQTVETTISNLVSKEANQIFPPFTRLNIHRSIYANGDSSYVMFFDHPFTSRDLDSVIMEFSDQPIVIRDVETVWRERGFSISPDEQKFEVNKVLLADLLSARDNTDFIEDLASRVRSEKEAWDMTMKEHVFAKALERTPDQKVQNIVLAEYARKIPIALRRHPDLWPASPKRDIPKVSDIVALGRFRQLGENARSQVMEEVLDNNSEEKKKAIIKQTYGINHELANSDGQKVFLLGKREDEQYDSFGSDVVRVTRGNTSVEISINADGVAKVFSHSGDFLLPYIQWITTAEGERKIVVDKPLVASSGVMIKSLPTARNAQIEYHYNSWQASNPLIGLMVIQSFYRDSLKTFPHEWAPALALIHKDEMSNQNLFSRSEKLFL